MTLPSLILGVLISTLCGLLFHLIFGGGGRRLAFYVSLGWLGFWAGHLFAAWRGWTFGAVGPLNMGTAVLFALGLLGVATALSLVQVGAADSDS